MKPTNSNKTGIKAKWMEVIMNYNQPRISRSVWQMSNTLIPFFTLWVLMILSFQYSYWITFFLAIITAGFQIRIFIIFHDCVHGSFFKSQRLNTIYGILLGIINFTPFHRWQDDHIIHHRTVGNLDKRGIGDVKTLTVDEYLKRSKWKRFTYRLYRNPFFLFGIAPLWVFLLQYRFTKSRCSRKINTYTIVTNIVLVGLVTLLIYAIGWKAYLLIQLPVLYIAAAHGIWLFYVQHQFEHVTWTHSTEWDYKSMALEGSSYFKLPAVLQWFTGNIGFHHIHHLSPIIPNYNLAKCHNENEMFLEIKPITLFSSLKSMMLRLWDEKSQRLIGFKELKLSDTK